MPGKLYKSAAIVGAAEANEIGFLKEPATSLQLHIEAIKNLSDQTGIPISRIEGVFSPTGWTTELCEHLGIKPKYIDTTAVGGCSFELHVQHAMAAIHAGIIDIALVTPRRKRAFRQQYRRPGCYQTTPGGAGEHSPSHENEYGLRACRCPFTVCTCHGQAYASLRYGP